MEMAYICDVCVSAGVILHFAVWLCIIGAIFVSTFSVRYRTLPFVLFSPILFCVNTSWDSKSHLTDINVFVPSLL